MHGSLLFKNVFKNSNTTSKYSFHLFLASNLIPILDIAPIAMASTQVFEIPANGWLPWFHPNYREANEVAHPRISHLHRLLRTGPLSQKRNAV